MKTNLLKITKLPFALYTVELNLTYPEVIQLFKSKPIYFHKHRSRLYFVGDPELVKVALGNEDVEIGKIDTDSTFVTNNWHIMRVLLYKILRFFLYKHGFGFHARFKNRVFMVRDKRYGTETLIYDYSDGANPAFVHEGFNFFFRLFGQEVFLGLDPCVVITRDGKNHIRVKDLSSSKYKEYKKWFIDRRYNSTTRRMFNTFTSYLCNGSTKVIIPVFSGQVEIDGGAIEIE